MNAPILETEKKLGELCDEHVYDFVIFLARKAYLTLNKNLEQEIKLKGFKDKNLNF